MRTTQERQLQIEIATAACEAVPVPQYDRWVEAERALSEAEVLTAGELAHLLLEHVEVHGDCPVLLWRLAPEDEDFRGRGVVSDPDGLTIY